MGYKIFSKIFTRSNLCKDLEKILLADLSDTRETYKCSLTLQDLSKILLAYSKISRSSLQDVSLGRLPSMLNTNMEFILVENLSLKTARA